MTADHVGLQIDDVLHNLEIFFAEQVAPQRVVVDGILKTADHVNQFHALKIELILVDSDDFGELASHPLHRIACDQIVHRFWILQLHAVLLQFLLAGSMKRQMLLYDWIEFCQRN